MIFIAYYTPDYKQDLDLYFTHNLSKLGIKYETIPVPDLGSWSFNTYYTPKVLLDALEKHKEMVIKVGADAVIHEYPKYFEELEKTDFDIAITFIDSDPANHADCSVVVANNTDKAKEFLRKWDAKCQDKIHQGISSVFCDEDVLAENSDEWFKEIKLVRLHCNYGQSWHFDKRVIGMPIIEDYRTSWHHNRNKV